MKYCLSILTFFFFGYCRAQCDSLSPKHFNLRISYNSSIIYPGAGTGIEYIAVHREKLKKSGRKVNTEEFLSANLDFYHHRTFHDNLYFTSEWGKRRTRDNGFCYEFSAGPGLSRTFISGATYKTDDDGNISIVKYAGNYYGIVTAGGGAGYDFSERKGLLFVALAKMNFLFMFPYNSTLYVRPVLELGIKYRFSKMNTEK